MFTVDRRRHVRTRLLERAREDERIVGAALTGSAARDAEDRWSDVDLFFGVADGVTVEEALSDWSAFAYRELGAIHHFDLHAGPATYRAFLLGELLEIDLGFTPAAAFGPLGSGGFRVVFGDAVERRQGETAPGHLIGLAWHHVLHARISIERGALWQAEYWISGIRDHILALACLRLGHPTAHAKGADRLPHDVTGPVREALVHTLDAGELSRALGAATRALLRELRETDSGIVETLEKPLLDLAAVS
ncbi:putative nucleotidyltransferase [Streptosporangium album]|uniref:Putative nucleotidyltransferase n=1 Tax=Streptosporangium album TaxID=47479 RepID=A0A7W7RU75_9ACTN|nr:nucleotidyltransferase domain-containing protein [Streptosporangium album]MBB4938319.1 putative nucleotidyltransferase [Streptosporangium album]